MKLLKFILKAFFFGTLLLVIAAGGLFLAVWLQIPGPVPDHDEIAAIEHISTSVVLDASETQIGSFYIEDRTPLSYEEISPWVIKALIDTEDKRFYDHSGVDYQSLLRVGVKTVLLGDRSAGGGSTISQQLAKNMWPRLRVSIFYYPVNKIREMIIAHRIESQYSKEQVLELYLNTVSFGLDIFGVESASRRYFGKRCMELSVQEAAMLVGMLKATTYYNPVMHPDRANLRKDLVLDLMYEENDLNGYSTDSLKSIPVNIKVQNQEIDMDGYVLSQIRRETQEILDSYYSSTGRQLNIMTDGLLIKTTLDRVLQGYARESIKSHMQWLQTQLDNEWSNSRWKALEAVLEREMSGNEDDHQKSERQFFGWDGYSLQDVSLLDSVKYHLKMLQTGFLAMEPGTGAIKTWVGGIDYRTFPYDHVGRHATRQVGSTFKPIVYAAAIEQGISPCKYYKAELMAYEDEEGEWVPQNHNADYEGKYSMEGALEASVNTVSVKVLKDVGIENALETARDLGITEALPEVPSIVLGTASISLIDMVTAYATLSNGGYHMSPYLISSITTSDGEVIYSREDALRTRAISGETSQMITYLLRNVVNDGTGRALKSTYGLSMDVGGKTGTTQSNADGWFIGVTPKLVAGAWVGGAYPSIGFQSSQLGQGAVMALPIFGKYFAAIQKDPKYRSISNARYPVLNRTLQNKMDCDPFKEDLNFFERLFGKKKDKKVVSESVPVDEKKENVFRKIGKLFKKKN